MTNAQQSKIMVNGRIPLSHSDGPPVDVHRGMIIKTRVGEEAGFSAGVVIEQGTEEASFILLGRLPVTSEYRLIPAKLINRVDGETIHLNADRDDILKLHLHRPV